MIKNEEQILAATLEGLSDALSVGFRKGASDEYMNTIDAAIVAIRTRLKILDQQANEKLKEFAEAFWKLRSDYPDVKINVRIMGDRIGDVEAIIDRGPFSSNPKVYLITQ